MSDAELYMSQALDNVELGLSTDFRPKPHLSLFRYLNCSHPEFWMRFEKMIVEQVLFATPASNLNDPFEVLPCIVDDIDTNVVMSLKQEPTLMQRLKGAVNPSYTKEEIKHYKTMAHELIIKRQKKCHIIALSERYDSPLLWSHYADSFKGIALHFIAGRMHSRTRQAKLTYSIPPFAFGKVSYVEQRPIYPLSLALSQCQFPGYLSVNPMSLTESDRLMYFYKSKDWEYEKEYRISINGLSFLPFNINSLVSIVLGSSFPEENVSKITNILENASANHVSIRKSSISESRFGVDVNWN